MDTNSCIFYTLSEVSIHGAKYDELAHDRHLQFKDAREIGDGKLNLVR